MDRQKKTPAFRRRLALGPGTHLVPICQRRGPKVEPQVRLVVAAHDMPLGTLPAWERRYTGGLPRKRNRPNKGAVFQAANAVNRVILVAMSASEPVLGSKLLRPHLHRGYLFHY